MILPGISIDDGSSVVSMGKGDWLLMSPPLCPDASLPVDEMVSWALGSSYKIS